MNDENSSSNCLPNQDERLIGLLEFEIKRIEDEQRRPGWTRWALGGTIGGAFWLILTQIEAHGGEIGAAKVLFLALVVSLAWDFAKSIRQLLLLGFGPLGQNARFFRTDLFVGARLVLFSMIILRIGLLAIGCFSPFLYGWSRLLTCSLLGLSTVSPVFGLWSSYRGWAFPVGGRPKQPAVIVWGHVIGVSIDVVLLITLWRSGIKQWHDFSIPELRVSILGAVILILIPLFLADQILSPVVAILVELRRRLGLRQITYDAARRSTEILMQGMDARAAYEPEIQGLVAKLDVLDSDVQRLFPELRTTTPQDAHDAATGARIDTCKDQLVSLEKRFRSVQGDSETLRWLHRAWDFLAHSSVESLKPLLASIDSREDAIKQKLENARREIESWDIRRKDKQRPTNPGV